MDSGALGLVEQIKELKAMHEFLDDKEFDRLLEVVVKWLSKPDVPPNNIDMLIVELQAISTKFAIAISFYKTIGTKEPDARYRKEAYYTLREATNSLVDAMKYLVRVRQLGGHG